MTLEELSYIGQAVAAIAVLVSLAAVWWQLRQTNRIAKADLTHSVWLSAGEMGLSLYDSPEKAELMHRALTGKGPLSDSERLRMDVVLSVALGVPEAGFNLRQRGLCEISVYNSLEASTRMYMRTSIAQDWWSR